MPQPYRSFENPQREPRPVPDEEPARDRPDDWQEEGRPDDDWPDDDWPEGDEPGHDQPGHGEPVPAWPAPRGFRGPGGMDARRRRTRPLTVAVVAMVAAAVGAAAALSLTRSPATSPAATTTPAGQPSGGAAGGNGVIPGTGGGIGGNGGAQTGQTLFLGGKVTAISGTSITITGQGQDFTAAITSSTRFTGVHGASGIKDGDLAGVQISGYGTGHPVATAIQDPAQMP